jgi:hypothetical protein
MVNFMNKMNVLSLVAVFALAACSNDVAAPVEEVAMTDKPATASGKPSPQFDGTVTKVGSPFSISYKIIGTPVVGSPVAIELHVTSAIETQSAELSFSIPDESSMVFHEAQPQAVAAEFAANQKWLDQRVTVVPMREGRIFLNVAASVDSVDGRTMTMMAVPIQVGQGGRTLEEQGELATDEDGEAIRVLTSE